MLKSFVYMFEDKMFWKKYLSLFGIVLIANLLINGSGLLAPVNTQGVASPLYYILLLAGFICLFVPYGYSISLLKTKIEDESQKELPSINIISNFIAGLKVVISGSLLLFAVIVIMILLFNLNGIVSGNIGTAISVLSNIILFLMFFTIIFFGIAMCCRYSVKPSYLNFVNFKAAAELINYDTAKYFKSFLVAGFCTFIIYLISFLSVSVLTKIGILGLVIYCIIVSLMWSYQIYLFAGLFSHAVPAEKI